MFSEGSETLLHVRDGVVYLVALILSIAVHEFGHAFVADKMGDRLPRSEGRVTLNPIAHVDPIGTVLFPLMAFVISISDPTIGSRILGWGRPVRVSGRGRKFHFLTSIAGPGMNIVFAVLLSFVYIALLKFGGESTAQLAVPVSYIIMMNIGLAFFNLIPCPPLDGGGILMAVLPRRLQYIGDFLEQYGPWIFFGLFFTGILSRLLYPARIVAHLWLNAISSVTL